MATGNIVTFEGPGKKMQVHTYPLPELLPGEVLVKNLYTTICGSDLHTYCGLRQEKLPTVLGHEIVGRIVKLHESHAGYDSAGSRLHEGDLVTWSVFSSNPASEYALRGMPQKAEGLFKYGHAQVSADDVFHGGLAEYCVLKVHTTILKLPEEIPLPVAAIINCAVATVSGAVRLAGNIQGKRILITGMGLLGIVCAAMCREEGANTIYAADINAERLRDAADFGADKLCLLNKSGELPGDNDFSVFPEAGIDVVFDMSGSPEAMEAGLHPLSIGGTAVWVGAVFHSRKIQVDPEQIVRKLVTIKGLHNYNYEDLKYAVAFIERCHKKYPFSRIVGEEFVLQEAEQAFEYALQHKPLRVGIRIA